MPIQRRVVECSKEIWNVVKPILCDDSPEGHLPQEMEEAQGLDTKGLLSYSFRAIHESRYVPLCPWQTNLSIQCNARFVKPISSD